MKKKKKPTQKQFRKEVKKILENFHFDEETRREIFSLVMQYATQKAQKPPETDSETDPSEER